MILNYLKDLNKQKQDKLNFVFGYKNKPLKERIAESERIYNKYNDRIPIIIGSNDIELSRNKFLVSRDITFGNLILIIRKYIKLDQTDALFICTESGKCLKGSDIIMDIWDRHHDIDNFLYLIIKKENTFG